MKKLNRKGFTLVELLAVIVILAIVVGITLVTVLPTLKNSRDKAFQLTADTAADYYQKQYELYATGYGSIIESTTQLSGDVDFVKAGLKAENYSSGTYVIDTTTGRVCVTLIKSKDGEYYDAEGSLGDGLTESSGCSAVINNFDGANSTDACKLINDVNGDGEINNDDAVYIQSYVAGISSYQCNNSCDVTGDGKVNGIDALRFKKCINNYYEDKE